MGFIFIFSEIMELHTTHLILFAIFASAVYSQDKLIDDELILDDHLLGNILKAYYRELHRAASEYALHGTEAADEHTYPYVGAYPDPSGPLPSMYHQTKVKKSPLYRLNTAIRQTRLAPFGTMLVPKQRKVHSNTPSMRYG